MFQSFRSILLAGVIGLISYGAAIARAGDIKGSKAPRDGVGRVLQAIASGEKLGADAPAQVPALIAVVKDGEPQESELAIRALAAMEANARPAVVAISKKLSDPCHATRSAAVDALVAIGDAAVEPLRRLLGSSTARTRAAAAQALSRLRRLDLGDVARLSKDPDPRVRAALASALADLGKPGVPRLADMLRDAELAVAVEAAHALESNREGAPVAIPALTRTPPATSASSGDDDGVRASSAAGTVRRTSHEWTVSKSYTDIKGYADRPDEPPWKTLGVEWQDPELDAFGNFCTVRGRVRRPDSDGNGTQPINWFQGVTVYLATTPGDRPDWSQGMNQADTVLQTAVTSPSGTFRVRFDLRKMNRDRNLAQSFQLGVALARHTVESRTSQSIVWDSRTPAISSTVRMLSVPAARELSRELVLINHASWGSFSNPNGVALVRAVNALRPLGKERALAILEKYIELTKSGDDPSDQAIVFWMIRLLFEPIRLGDRIPSPAIAVHLDDDRSVEAMKWPLNPMEVSEDIPFMVGHRIGMAGQAEPPSSHIRWARLHGVIRDDPLAPSANPLAAAEALLRSRRFKALDDFSRREATRAIRSQALAMVVGLVSRIPARDRARDDLWKDRLRAAAERGIHWDVRREQFVARE